MKELENAEAKEHFKVKRILNIKDLKLGDVLETSDYVISNEEMFIQLEYINGEEKRYEVPIKPGVYTAKYTGNGLKLFKTDFTDDNILEAFVNTKEITDKVDCFLRNVHKYKELGFDVAKRSMLLFGPPGSGKSASITTVIKRYISDEKTAVVIWKTDVVEPDDIKHMIAHFKYEGVEKLFFIAEDIGGIEAEDARINSRSSLLSLLDNQEKTFKIPTLIIATTNFPEMFLANIANRPQRFDDKIRVGYPPAEAREALLKFISKETASEEALAFIKQAKFNEFTPAHIKEVVVRSVIYEKEMISVMNDMIKEIEQYNKNFSNKKAVGFSFEN